MSRHWNVRGLFLLGSELILLRRLLLVFLVHRRNEAELHELADGLQLLRLGLLRVARLRNVARPGARVVLLAFREKRRVVLERLNDGAVDLLAFPEVAERCETRPELLRGEIREKEIARL